MTGRLEGAKNYLVSIAERSTGLARAKEYYHDNKPDSNNPLFKAPSESEAIIGATMLGLTQVNIPLQDLF